jgi:excisionase family DNA binding protein
MDDLLTPIEVANHYRVGRNTVYQWIAAGLLPVTTLPHRKGANIHKSYRIKRETLDRLTQEQVAS